MQNLKQQLLEVCKNKVDQNITRLMESMDSLKTDLNSATKSSAGDKHETGRAMLQLEMEKIGEQLKHMESMKSVLKSLNIEQQSGKVALGSLIITDKLTYFLSSSIGQIDLNNKNYFAVSTHSPIGKQLLGKQVGEQISFNNAQILEIL